MNIFVNFVHLLFFIGILLINHSRIEVNLAKEERVYIYGTQKRTKPRVK